MQWCRQEIVSLVWAEREVLGCRDGEEELDARGEEEEQKGLREG